MTIMQRLSMFEESLPRCCLYCKHGYPVVFGTDSFLDAFMCGVHILEGLKTKKITLKLESAPPDFKPFYCPITDPDCSCAQFTPVKFGSRKFKLLDFWGMFKETEV